MAATLDINILCKKILETDILENLAQDYGVSINSITSIDNWEWENEQQIKPNHLTRVIDENKIVSISLTSPSIKDLGIYIEKVNNIYLYTFWLNTVGYPELDCDTITLENNKYYEKVYQSILKIDNEELNRIEAIGIGIETNICCDGNILDMIQNSQNIIVWALNENLNAEIVLKNYIKKSIRGFKKTLFEKIK